MLIRVSITIFEHNINMTREGEKYRKYVKLRNQVKNMIRKAKAVMEKNIAKDVKKIQNGSENMLTQKGKQNSGYRS